MRQINRATLAGLLLALPSALAGGAGQPIPQDPDRQKQRFDDMLEWNRRTLGGAYEKVGSKDPKWDEAAREALDAAARVFSHAIDPPAKNEDIFKPAKRAIDAGCGDPLILYLYARSSSNPNYPGPEELGRRYTNAATALEKSAYPPFRKATALWKAGAQKSDQKTLSPEARKEAARFLDAAVAMVAKSVKEDERNPDMDNNWFEIPKDAIQAHRQLSGNYQTAFDRVDAQLAKVPGLSVIRMQVKADFLIKSGWEARGIGFIDTVTPEGARLFQQRLAEARSTLSKAWELKPNDGRTATLMLHVEVGIGGGNRNQMEMWFERAMLADGNNYEACQQKLLWLEPKWYGSVDDVLAFGQACRETKNWRARITLLAAEAHMRKAQQLPRQERGKYLGSPQVWNDIQSVYEEYLAQYPYDNRERSFYAAYCYSSGHYVESDKQFRAVGDNLVWREGIFPEKWMKETRAYVAEKAKSIEQPPMAKPTPPPVQGPEPKPAEAPAVTASPPIKMNAPAVAPPQPATQPESGGSIWWIWVLFGVGAVLIVGGALFFFLFSGSGGGRDDDRYDEDEEEERPRRKKRRRR